MGTETEERFRTTQIAAAETRTRRGSGGNGIREKELLGKMSGMSDMHCYGLHDRDCIALTMDIGDVQGVY